MNNLLIKTPIEKHNAMLDQLEALVDASTVSGVLDLLAEVCSAKADHVRTNWQDEYGADIWDKMAVELLNSQARILRIK